MRYLLGINNDEIKDKIVENLYNYFKLSDSVRITDSFKDIKNAEEDEYIIVLEDENHLLKIEDEELDKSFNTLSTVLPGKHRCDYFIDTSKSSNLVEKDLQARINDVSTYELIIKDIQRGNIQVKFNNSLFGAGTPNILQFQMSVNGKDRGWISLLDDNTFEIYNIGFIHRTFTNYGWESRDNKFLLENLQSIVLDAFKRDDKEVVDILSKNNQDILSLYGYNFEDISRDDILNNNIIFDLDNIDLD